MKFYRVSKSQLKWKEMTQISYNWNLPILINVDYEVILGNSLKDSLPDSIIVVVMDNNQRDLLYQALEHIESKIAEENSESRINQVYIEFRDFFKEVRKPRVETLSLFEIKENHCITEDTYIDPPPYDFTKHNHIRELFNEGNVLMEEFIEIEEKRGKTEPEIEIDLEILKELL